MSEIWGQAWREFMGLEGVVAQAASAMWACRYCKAHHNRADDRQCFVCGAPR